MKYKSIALTVLATVSSLMVTPASANPPLDSIWDRIDENVNVHTFRQLVLIAGLAPMLDTCGNGSPFYTAFVPYNFVFDNLFAELDTSIAELAASPDVVRGIVEDHIVNGSFSSEDLQNDSVTRLVARSGFVLTVTDSTPTPNDRVVGPDMYISDQQMVGPDLPFCNGFIYWLFGFIDSTPQVPTEGLNAQDSPTDGTPGGSNSLPDTL